MREIKVENALTAAVKQRGGLCLKWVSPSTVGVPDRIVIMPNAKVYFVETKAPGKPLSPMQAKMIKELRARGHAALKLDSLTEVDLFARLVLDGEK